MPKEISNGSVPMSKSQRNKCKHSSLKGANRKILPDVMPCRCTVCGQRSNARPDTSHDACPKANPEEFPPAVFAMIKAGRLRFKGQVLVSGTWENVSSYDARVNTPTDLLAVMKGEVSSEETAPPSKRAA